MIDNCKLYRNLYDIFHPSISRKNISNYEIIFKENLIPVRVFYPGRETKLEKVILYIHGDKVNYKVYEEIAKKTDCIVMFLAYRKESVELDCNNIIEYLLGEFKKCSISFDNIIVMGDYVDSKVIKNLRGSSELKKLFIMPEVDLEKEINNVMIITESESTSNKKNIYQIDERLDQFILNNNLSLNEKIYQIINQVVG